MKLKHIAIAALPALGAALDGGTFQGVMSLKDGQHVAVVYLGQAENKAPHAEQMAWAESQGGTLANRAVLNLLRENGLEMVHDWTWTCELYGSGSDCAWHCSSSGTQYYDYRSASGGGVAVRLIPLVLQSFVPGEATEAAITVGDAEAQLHALADRLGKQLRAQAEPTTTITVQGVEIVLKRGEAYAGAMLNPDGSVDYHLIKLPDLDGKFTWDDAMVAAQKAGGDLPAPREAWMLHAQGLFPDHWIWLNKAQGSASAWGCYSDGTQLYRARSASGGCVAVRRFKP